MNLREELETIASDLSQVSNGRVDEAGLSRVLKVLEDKKDFLIITAFRGDKSKDENQKNNNKLIKALRDKFGKKIGAYKLVGHWKECKTPLKDNETIKDCKDIVNIMEESWLIPRPDFISQNDFFDAAKQIAKSFNQDAFIIRLNGKLTLNGKDGSEWANLGKADKKSISTGFQKIVDIQGYSELKKNRAHGKNINIVFENLGILAPDDNISSKMLFKYANILY